MTARKTTKKTSGGASKKQSRTTEAQRVQRAVQLSSTELQQLGMTWDSTGKARTREGGPRATVLQGDWLIMANAAGNIAKLADLLGVHVTTVHRWGTGGAIPPATRRLIALVAFQLGVRSPVPPV